VDLLGAFLQVHFGCCPILAPDVYCHPSGQVGDEVPFAKLVHLFSHWHHFEGAKAPSTPGQVLKFLYITPKESHMKIWFTQRQESISVDESCTL